MRVLIASIFVAFAMMSCSENPVASDSADTDMVLMYAQNVGGSRNIAMYTDSAFIDSCPKYQRMQIYVKNGIGLNNSGIGKQAVFNAAPGAIWYF